MRAGYAEARARSAFPLSEEMPGRVRRHGGYSAA